MVDAERNFEEEAFDIEEYLTKEKKLQALEYIGGDAEYASLFLLLHKISQEVPKISFVEIVKRSTTPYYNLLNRIYPLLSFEFFVIEKEGGKNFVKFNKSFDVELLFKAENTIKADIEAKKIFNMTEREMIEYSNKKAIKLNKGVGK